MAFLLASTIYQEPGVTSSGPSLTEIRQARHGERGRLAVSQARTSPTKAYVVEGALRPDLSLGQS